MSKKIIWALVGPSGSGKTTVGMGTLKKLGIPEIVSHTTRAPRVGEEEGVTYYYVTKEDFDKLEKVEEVCYAGNYYCTSKNEIERKFEIADELGIIVSIEGVEALKEVYGDAVKAIFMNVNREECIKRMIARGDSEEAIESRKRKFEESNEFDNGKYCDFIYDGGYLPMDEDMVAFEAFYNECKKAVMGEILVVEGNIEEVTEEVMREAKATN